MSLEGLEGPPAKFSAILKSPRRPIGLTHPAFTRPPGSRSGEFYPHAPVAELIERRVSHLFHAAEIRALQESGHGNLLAQRSSRFSHGFDGCGAHRHLVLWAHKPHAFASF